MDYTIKSVADGSRNKVALTASGIMNVVIIIAYFVEVLKGVRTIPSYLFIVGTCLFPIVAGIFVYMKKKDSLLIRYFIAVCFAMVYCYILFETKTNTTFCYVIVIFLILIIYMDKKISIGLGCVAVGINVWRLVDAIAQDKLTPIFITEMEIVLICLILSVVFALLSLHKINQINEANIKKAQEEKQQAAQLLEKIVQVAESMALNIKEVTDETNVLHDSIETTKMAMDNLSSGAAMVAEAVETQQENTGEISTQIQQVGSGTKTVYESAVSSKTNLEKGQEIMSNLLSHVENAEKVNKLVATEMTELHTKSEQMGNIVDLINDVASQTELLALNASIEAARAGEAGKGFAVVAGEITNLAGQTENATGKIVALITDIRKSLENVNSSVEELLESNHKQGMLVEENAKSFDAISVNTNDIMEQMNQLQDVVDTVEQANEIVVGNITNVSAATQEITTEANMTLDSCEVNLRSIQKVREIIERLNLNAEQLKQG